MMLGGKLAGVGRPGAALHDGEFVAAEAGHRVGAAHHALQALGHRAQQRVADRMAERIVDALEAVEIEEHDRELVRRAPSACSILSRNSTRFGRLVSASWRAMCMILASAWRRSVTSS